MHESLMKFDAHTCMLTITTEWYGSNGPAAKWYGKRMACQQNGRRLIDIKRVWQQNAMADFKMAFLQNILCQNDMALIACINMAW